MRASALLALAVCAGACGDRNPAPAAPVDEVAAARMHRFAWLLGRWTAGDPPTTVEQWVETGDDGALGVGFNASGADTTFFEVLAIRGEPPTYLAFPDGAPPTAFALVEASDLSATFANPAHDDPSRIAYRRDGDTLTAVLDGAAGPRSLTLRLADSRPAPELELADRAFAADSARRGGDAWGEAFAAGGVLMPASGGRFAGPDAVRLVMSRTFLDPKLRLTWEPTASGWSPAGDAGFTAGRYRMWREGVAGSERAGSYVTVWVRDGDRWRIQFDAGFADGSGQGLAELRGRGRPAARVLVERLHDGSIERLR